MKSKTLPLYTAWLEVAPAPQIAFVDQVFAMCEENYERGGDTIVECLTPSEILAEFTTLTEAKRYCGMHLEQGLEARWGEESDPQLARWNAHKEWK